MADIVYSTLFDKRYTVEVERTGDYTADLKLSEGEKLLKTWPVVLSYGALFGSDVEDIASWQRIVIEYIDKELPNESKDRPTNS